MAAGNFDTALQCLLAHEGGYANHPADPGGPTNLGITLAVYRQTINPNATANELRGIGRAEASAIYRAKYWNALRCDQLPPGLDYALFDYGVNSGPARAAAVMRRLVETTPGTTIDDAVLMRIRARGASALIAALCDERLAFLRRLKTWSAFGAGWSRRVADVRATALKMAAGQDFGAPPVKRSQGKGIVPIEKTAQRGAAGGALASGAVAAEQAQGLGAGPCIVAGIVLVALATAAAAWMFWRWRQQRLQAAV